MPRRSHQPTSAAIWSLALTAAVAALASSACAPVPAYQRGRLAHRTMRSSHAESAARDHLHAIHEGAIGGPGGETSGCGCN